MQCCFCWEVDFPKRLSTRRVLTGEKFKWSVTEYSRMTLELWHSVRLILVKIELNAKQFMLGYIYLKVSWTINLKFKITFAGKSFKSQFQVRVCSQVKINLTQSHPKISKSTNQFSCMPIESNQIILIIFLCSWGLSHISLEVVWAFSSV